MDLEEPTEPVDAAQLLHRGAATEIEEIHQYIYAGGKLLRETITEGETTKTLDFTYDNVGMPYSLIYNNGTTTTTYYYITNLQGDVMYLVDASGNEVVAYDYDPYGKVITSTGELAEVNPLRYRGYYYDTETGFYYLQSRYYDPEICRFINADSYASTGQGFVGFNMFAYCNNAPTNYTDSTGNSAIGAALLRGAISAVASGLTTLIFGGNWSEAGLSAISGFFSGISSDFKNIVIGIEIFINFCRTLNDDYSWPYFLTSSASMILFSRLNASAAEQLSGWFSNAMLDFVASCMDTAAYKLEEAWFPHSKPAHTNPVRPAENDTTVVLPKGGGVGCLGIRSPRAKFICYIN